ncbi:hypothetical protein C8J35_101781 [Rhizobium sp. PP-F2F-G38]|nr:hypothetical protein C8J35_101781 [Rhizobium sp. PP-F2F-G38]
MLQPLPFSALDLARRQTAANLFMPTSTIRLDGQALFRSQSSRDLGCLLDVDDSVASWMCMPAELPTSLGGYVPDFLVCYEDGTGCFIDVCDHDLGHVTRAAAKLGLSHQVVAPSSFVDSFRLRNAKQLLRYAHYRTPAGDQIRMIAALKACGSMTIKAASLIFREIQPMAGIASLTLSRHISIDLDSEPIGPNSLLRPSSATIMR